MNSNKSTQFFFVLKYFFIGFFCFGKAPFEFLISNPIKNSVTVSKWLKVSYKLQFTCFTIVSPYVLSNTKEFVCAWIRCMGGNEFETSL